MAIHFLQGGKDYFSTVKSEDEQIDIIKNKILEFFNIKNVHFLFGSGSSCPAIPNMHGLYTTIKEAISKEGDIKVEEKDLFNEISKIFEENLEQILGVLYSKREFLRGSNSNYKEESDFKECDKLIKFIERNIFDKLNVLSTESEHVISVLDTYKKFYQKIAIRNKDLSRINIFTTNNDLFNETALDSLNIHYVNGFNGGLNKFFNPAMFNYTFSKRMDTTIDRYEPVENMVYLYKIHGSINWKEDSSNNSYFDIKEEYFPTYDDKTVLIYPTPLKQNKSLGSPYSDLFREFQHKLLEANSVLFVIGYSFSDEHVNDIIYRALATNSTFNLIIIDNIKEDKQICKVGDNRVFRIWEDCASDDTPIHYFSRIVDELLPDLNAFKHKDALQEFIKQLKSNVKGIYDENRKDYISGV